MCLEPLEAYRVVALLFAVGLFISTAEFLALKEEFRDDGIFSWKVHQLEWAAFLRTGFAGRFFAALLGEKGVRFLMTIRAIALLMLPFTEVAAWSFSLLLGIIVLVTLVFSSRHSFGSDGADQMLALLGITMLISANPLSSPGMLRIGLYFIAAQSCLSYSAAGIAKLVSPQWRSGGALSGILNTGANGSHLVGQWLVGRPRLCLLLAWTVILIESSFPAGLMFPSTVLWLFLGWGLLFHLLNAVIMGLNCFVWAFVATYPAIVFTAGVVNGLSACSGFLGPGIQ